MPAPASTPPPEPSTRTDEPATDERAMRRFLPPEAPLAMPLQDLTPRTGVRSLFALVRHVFADAR